MADTARTLSAFVNASTGLFKDGDPRSISAQDLRDFVVSVFGVSGVVSKTGTYTATDDDQTILCNGSFTLTLPAAADRTNKLFCIKNTGTGVITIDGDGAETIDNSTNVLLNQYDSLTIVSDGTEWWII